ncbi:MAG: MerR family transcriptional regulator [Mangrovibacterium sp.]
METKKIHYSVREVAQILNVSESNVRYWEREFSSIKPYIGGRGVRFFTQQDIDEFQLVKYLVKERKYTIAGAKKKLKENKNDIINKHQMVDRLHVVKTMLQEIKDALEC